LSTREGTQEHNRSYNCGAYVAETWDLCQSINIFANQGLRSSTHTFSSPLVYLTAKSKSPGSAI